VVLSGRREDGVRFLARRLSFYAVTAWAALTLNFLIPRLMPGNPVQIVLSRLGGQPSAATIKTLNTQFGNTDASLAVQYWHYWSNILHGNLGPSVQYYPTPVTEVIRQALPWTVALVGSATVIAFTLGTLGGIVAASRSGGWADMLLPATMFFYAVPYFWVALLVLTAFSVHLAWFPVTGGSAPDLSPAFTSAFVGSALWHGALPVVTIVVSSLATFFLGMRNMMMTTLDEDYVLLAEAKGLPRRRVLFAYAARNALLPNVAAFALSLGFVVSGAILTEIVFSYPGIGYHLFTAVTNLDYPLMQGIFLVITLVVLLANLLADVVYLMLDPRARQEQ
jgi:peptide/nickel transport system permease protein